MQLGAASAGGAAPPRFGAGVSAADHNHIKLLGVKHLSPL
jgi:hypothetical protein